MVYLIHLRILNHSCILGIIPIWLLCNPFNGWLNRWFNNWDIETYWALPSSCCLPILCDGPSSVLCPQWLSQLRICQVLALTHREGSQPYSRFWLIGCWTLRQQLLKYTSKSLSAEYWDMGVCFCTSHPWEDPWLIKICWFVSCHSPWTWEEKGSGHQNQAIKGCLL